MNNNFEKFGFKKPTSFECEILQMIYTSSGKEFIGYLKEDDEILACSWDKKGSCFIGINIDEKYNLTPIKKWYEIADNFPCLVIRSKGDIDLAWKYERESETIFYTCSYENVHGCRLATKEEALQLVLEEKQC